MLPFFQHYKAKRAVEAGIVASDSLCSQPAHMSPKVHCRPRQPRKGGRQPAAQQIGWALYTTTARSRRRRGTSQCPQRSWATFSQAHWGQVHGGVSPLRKAGHEASWQQAPPASQSLTLISSLRRSTSPAGFGGVTSRGSRCRSAASLCETGDGGKPRECGSGAQSPGLGGVVIQRSPRFRPDSGVSPASTRCLQLGHVPLTRSQRSTQSLWKR